MELVAAAVVIVFVLVIITRGSLRQFINIPVKVSWLLLVGLGLQIAIEAIEFPKNQIETVGYGLLMTSYGLILAFCFVNLRQHGFGVIAIGIAMNTLVIGLNQGMPARALREDANGRLVEKPIEQSVKHRPERDNDLLPFLGDQIRLPAPLNALISIGDIVIMIGLAELTYFGSRRPRRRGIGAQTVVSNPRPRATRSSAPSARPS